MTHPSLINNEQKFPGGNTLHGLHEILDPVLLMACKRSYRCVNGPSYDPRSTIGHGT